jgi:hypothetical protein
MTDKEIAKRMVCRLNGHKMTGTIPPYCNDCFQEFIRVQPIHRTYTSMKREFLNEKTEI